MHLSNLYNAFSKFGIPSIQKRNCFYPTLLAVISPITSCLGLYELKDSALARFKDDLSGTYNIDPNTARDSAAFWYSNFDETHGGKRI